MNNKIVPSIIITVLILTLSQRTSCGSWKNLERKFSQLQDHHDNRHLDRNRIHFPDEDYDNSSWHPETQSKGEASREECLASCAASREYRPVCGTNGVTYQNMDQLRCDILCGVAVELHHSSPCESQTPFITTTTTSTTSAPVVTTARNPELQWCISSCPSTPEYNPVCGTNLVTYNNIGKLRCEKYCGVDVQVWRHYRCPITISTTEPAPISTSNTLQNFEIQNCISRCPVTTQYDPVCGTNDVTYKNIGGLECAKACGVDVNFKHLWPCSNPLISMENPNYEDQSNSGEDYDVDIDIRYPDPEGRRHF